MPDDIDQAVDECDEARNKAALPLTFTEEARRIIRERTEAQFRANIPRIAGGFAAVRKNVLRASTLTGSLAKAFALFHNPKATTISVEHMARARAETERECKIKLGQALGKPPESVGVADGLSCDGG